MLKIILNKLKPVVQIIILIYTVYRIINVLLVAVFYQINKEQIEYIKNNGDKTGFYINFEYPAPEINSVIQYDTLAFCHKCLVNKEAYEKNNDYNQLITRMNLSVLLLPWTSLEDIFSYVELHHQYGTYNGKSYDIKTRCGYNVFTLNAEETILFVDGYVMCIFAILPLIMVINLFFVIKNFLLKLSVKQVNGYNVVC